MAFPRTDAGAFRRIRQRLQDDIGALIDSSRTIAPVEGSAPFWALARALFPIAESIGDLVFRSDGTSENLIKALEELDAIRNGYNGKAAIIALLYRHSLTHTDEVRKLRTRHRVVGWRLAFDEPAEHLKVEYREGTAIVGFDLTTFYDDLVSLCRTLEKREMHGKAIKRYKSWTELDLVAKTKLSKAEKQTLKEINKLVGE